MTMSHQPEHHGHGDGGHGHHGHDFSEMQDILRQDYQLKSERMMEFLDRIGLTAGWHVLEIGCGFAFLLDFYLKRVGPTGSVTLSDPDAKFGEHLAPRLGDNVRFVASGGEEVGEKCRCLGNADGYDLVVLGNVFYHLKSVNETLSAVKSILRSGGQIVVFDFLHDTCRLFTTVQTRIPQLLGPEMDTVNARCVELLAGAGMSIRREDNYVLSGKPGSDLWRLYTPVHIPFALDALVEKGALSREEREEIVAKELPAVAKDAGAVLFSDVIIQVAAAKQ